MEHKTIFNFIINNINKQQFTLNGIYVNYHYPLTLFNVKLDTKHGPPLIFEKLIHNSILNRNDIKINIDSIQSHVQMSLKSFIAMVIKTTSPFCYDCPSPFHCIYPLYPDSITINNNKSASIHGQKSFYNHTDDGKADNDYKMHDLPNSVMVAIQLLRSKFKHMFTNSTNNQTWQKRLRQDLMALNLTNKAVSITQTTLDWSTTMQNKYGLDQLDIQNYKYNFIKSLPGYINNDISTFFTKHKEQINKIRTELGLEFIGQPTALSTHLNYLQGYQFIVGVINMDEDDITQFINCLNGPQIEDLFILLGLNRKDDDIHSIVIKCQKMSKHYHQNKSNINKKRKRITDIDDKQTMKKKRKFMTTPISLIHDTTNDSEDDDSDIQILN